MSRLVGLAVLLAAAGVAGTNRVAPAWVNKDAAGYDLRHPYFDDGGWSTSNLVVHVYPRDDWTSACLALTLHGGFLSQHNERTDCDPDLAVGFVHALTVDTVFDIPRDC